MNQDHLNLTPSMHQNISCPRAETPVMQPIYSDAAAPETQALYADDSLLLVSTSHTARETAKVTETRSRLVSWWVVVGYCRRRHHRAGWASRPKPDILRGNWWRTHSLLLLHRFRQVLTHTCHSLTASCLLLGCFKAFEKLVPFDTPILSRLEPIWPFEVRHSRGTGRSTGRTNF